MSNCCKGKCWTKFLPHNWLCLKGLYFVFVALFYVALVFAIYMAIQILTFPMISGKEMWMALGIVEAQVLGTALALLTISKVLKVLAKIKHAVAPCCCTEEKNKEEKKKEVKKEEKAK